eukprot:scaffold22555_cov119-Skeletonema_marinoi.AAC.1
MKWERARKGILPSIKKKDSNRDDITEGQWDVCLRIAAALDYLHEKNIIFRDLKPANVGFDVRGDVKLFDFGLATIVSPEGDPYEDTFEMSGAGSPRYMSPEVLKGEPDPYNLKADVYTFSIVVWQILSLQQPFSFVQSRDELVDHVVNQGGRPEIPSSWPKAIKEKLGAAFDVDMSIRPTMSSFYETIRFQLLEGADTEKSDRFAHRAIQRRRSVFSLKLINGGEEVKGPRGFKARVSKRLSRARDSIAGKRSPQTNQSTATCGTARQRQAPRAKGQHQHNQAGNQANRHSQQAHRVSILNATNSSSSIMAEDQHYLDAYLANILPKLGLDVDTYGPYVTGADEEDDLDDIIDLLRASSESHSDDDDSWIDFKLQIEQRRKDYISGEEERKNEAALEAERLKKESLQKEIEIAKINALEVEQRLEAKKLEAMSAEKLALLDKFGYEVEDEEDEEEDTGVTTNRDHAVKQSAEHSQKLRSNNQPSKMQLRAETKKATADKNAKKEERRKRASKGERKR